MPARESFRLRSRAIDKSTALRVGADMFQLFLYGLYLSIFVYCMHKILTKRRSRKWPFIAVAALMFGISTTEMAVTIFYLFRYTLNGTKPPVRYPRYLLFITNNIFADAILIHRFYTTWNRKRRLIIPPFLVLLCASICGYLFSNSTSTHFRRLFLVSMWMTFGLNTCLTLLIGGKLFWSGRQARSILGPEVILGQYSVPSLIIESGSVYSIYLLLNLVIHSIFLRAGLSQIVGIVPTMIIIRTFVGRPAALNDPNRAPAGGSSTPVLDSIYSTMGGGTGVPNTATHSLGGGGSSLQEHLPPEHFVLETDV